MLAGGARLTPAPFHAICALSTRKNRIMTGTARSSDGLEIRRRKLLFRSWHRGMREMDLILGGFADAELGALTTDEIDQYESLIEIPDTELLPIITGERPVPDSLKTSLFLKILAFSRGKTP
jgi:antitoxin CptB